VEYSTSQIFEPTTSRQQQSVDIPSSNEIVANQKTKKKRRVWKDEEQKLVIQKVKNVGGPGRGGIPLAIKQLQREYPGQFETLSKSMVQRWWAKWETTDVVRVLARAGRKPVFSAEQLDQLKQVIEERIESDISISLRALRPVVCAYIKAFFPGILESDGGAFKCSIGWLRKLVCRDMKMVMRKATTSRDLPSDWQEKLDAFAKRLAGAVFIHNIPKELVVNADQTGWDLAPNRGRKLARKGDRTVAMRGLGDKRRVTIVAACSAAGNMLPPQLVLKGKRHQSLPKLNMQDRHYYSWHFALNPASYWSNQETMRHWVTKILRPYLRETKQRLGLDGNQKSVLILDCWSVHRSKEFREYIEQQCPDVVILYVPASCTSKGQVVDLVVNWPMKNAGCSAFEDDVMEQVDKQLRSGISPEEVLVDLSMKSLRNKLPMFVRIGHERLVKNPGMVLNGWKAAGLDRAWDREFQRESIRMGVIDPIQDAQSDDGEGGEADPMDQLRNDDCGFYARFTNFFDQVLRLKETMDHETARSEPCTAMQATSIRREHIQRQPSRRGRPRVEEDNFESMSDTSEDEISMSETSDSEDDTEIDDQ
jgi:hypothetical protein